MQLNSFSPRVLPNLSCVMCVHLGLSVGRVAMAYHTGVVTPSITVQEVMVEGDLGGGLESKLHVGEGILKGILADLE